MKLLFLFLPLGVVFLRPGDSLADDAAGAFDRLRTCIMANDVPGCKALVTPNSWDLYDRFTGYGLLQCLPTNWVVESQKQAGAHIILNASMPASNTTKYLLHLAYFSGSHKLGYDPTPLLDIPYSLKMGLGERWEGKVKLAEQLYLMMKANLGDKLTCDKLQPLLK